MIIYFGGEGETYIRAMPHISAYGFNIKTRMSE